ncbi:putative phosphoenolpyruvate carboxylase [Rosa chinensis]|uniref:Putative phosphoenolpyruvate carboxylase n=1 Tax=Rosa chinensis TaxID=74649 RepID=A0A2P6QBB9_ROSCH|nr:putative phosphoenolpyruvate carboxylase [Rosa chinensis]
MLSNCLVTKDVSLLSRWMTIDLYIREVDSLKFELSMNRCSDILSKLAQEILEHSESASEDHQSWDHQCYNRNQVKQQAATLPTQLPARANQPSCTGEHPIILLKLLFKEKIYNKIEDLESCVTFILFSYAAILIA